MEAAERSGALTEEDLQALPDDGYLYELVEGGLLREPRPAPAHGRVQVRLSQVLATFVQASGLGEVYSDVGFVLAKDPDTVRGPDVAFVSRRTLARIEDDTRLFPGAPDLAIEVLSPSNRPAEIHAKIADYLAAGACWVWIVDPEKKTVTTYRSLLAPRRLGARDLLNGEDVLPGFSIPVRELFEF